MLGPRLEGERGIALVPRELAHGLLYPGWAGRPETSRFWGPRAGNWTPAEIAAEHRKESASEDGVHWTITLDGAPVGFTGIDGIDWIRRQGESYIFIGEHTIYRRGVASEAMRLRTDFAFRELGLHRVYNWISAENVGSRRGNEKAGYRRQGLIPKVFKRGPRRLDVWMGEVLREEWKKGSTP